MWQDRELNHPWCQQRKAKGLVIAVYSENPLSEHGFFWDWERQSHMLHIKSGGLCFSGRWSSVVKTRKGVIQEKKVSTVIHYGEHVYWLWSLFGQIFGCPVRDILRNKVALHQFCSCTLLLSLLLRTAWRGRCQQCFWGQRRHSLSASSSCLLASVANQCLALLWVNVCVICYSCWSDEPRLSLSRRWYRTTKTSWILFPPRHCVWCPMDREDTITKKEKVPVSNVVLSVQVWVELKLVEMCEHENDWVLNSQNELVNIRNYFFLCLILSEVIENSFRIQSNTLKQIVLTVFSSLVWCLSLSPLPFPVDHAIFILQ